ncbi:glucan phosphoethanolaminetransferase (alkaline phosphatase superfamily) [Rhodopseudomonas rhenobacensis]|uniref:Glucan phosphoethanolaminetransferase (Alkaline phosphatase superfamily) n=1 Tax=Rhodopseudomonas rhenobacensis TaxID=87461 RepID=A0A7W7Z2Z8_9BRAD|nr:sulfatase-like hydrolase/transferase [Rhodopseudomonas rhenobacensis]MBB5047026.1 glucan phosphoethanolaminetransferase (alkaline phosphatase superfamily) [Rhodopseudomonas rhenobacensis]
MTVAVPYRRAVALVIFLALLVAPGVFLYRTRSLLQIDGYAIAFSEAICVCVLSLATAGHLRLLHSRRRGTRYLAEALALAVAVLIGAVAAIYVGSYYATALWGDGLTFDLVSESLMRPRSLLDLTGFDQHLAPIIGVVALAVPLALGALYGVVSRVLAAVAYTFDGSSRRRSIRAAALALVGLAAFSSSAGAYIFIAKKDLLAGEPLLNFFGFTKVSQLMDLDQKRLVAALQDRESQASYPKQPAFEKKNVILILSDSLRADRMGVYGYPRQTTPFLSELQARHAATRVEMALSSCSESYCGIATTLASRPFHQLSTHNFKLNSLLRSVGYRVNYYLSGKHRGWSFLWDFYGTDIDGMYDPVLRNAKIVTDDRETIGTFRGIEAYDGTPRFLYFFLMSSHNLGRRFPEFNQFGPLTSAKPLIGRLITQPPQSFDSHGVTRYPPVDDKDRMLLGDQFDNGVLQADAMIREIFTILEQKGYLKNSLVVILSDHGEELGERGRASHGRFLYQESIHVPLILVDDDLTRYNNTKFATQIDVAPTIVDRLGLPVPSSWQGVSLLRPPQDRLTVHQTRWRETPCLAFVHKTGERLFKYIKCKHDNKIESEEFFDLGNDPDELHNLISEGPADEIALLRAEASRQFGRLVCAGSEDSCIRGRP